MAFKLLHTALYAKLWYKRFHDCEKSTRKTIWDDLKIVMSLDGYSGEYMSNGNITNVIFNRCAEPPGILNLQRMVLELDPSATWRFGYFTEKTAGFVNPRWRVDKYDYSESVVYYCLSALVNADLKVLGVENLPMPDYTKLPRPNHITDKTLKEFFG